MPGRRSRPGRNRAVRIEAGLLDRAGAGDRFARRPEGIGLLLVVELVDRAGIASDRRGRGRSGAVIDDAQRWGVRRAHARSPTVSPKGVSRTEFPAQREVHSPRFVQPGLHAGPLAAGEDTLRFGREALLEVLERLGVLRLPAAGLPGWSPPRRGCVA